MSPAAPARPRRIARSELEGFWAGVARRLEDRRRDGAADLEGERELRQAGEWLRSGDLGSAERLLTDLDRRLRRAVPERMVSERPRGLVGYVTKDPAEAPTPPEEDRLRNRLLLLGRLATVQRARGSGIERALALLREASAALESGDRERAQRRGDEAARALEAGEDEEPTPARPRDP
ncbi:MAG TPA: hypothetical protein VGV64_02550 [Thermoplasmata archaeon]|nr:hypothetical protein [Thermoplasmata archaeon]